MTSHSLVKDSDVEKNDDDCHSKLLYETLYRIQPLFQKAYCYYWNVTIPIPVSQLSVCVKERVWAKLGELGRRITAYCPHFILMNVSASYSISRSLPW